MNILIETERAWTAGIIDGEGCIWLDRNRPMLEVWNTDIRMLEKLKGLFDGMIYEVIRKNRPRTKICWRWRITGKKVIYCLEMILPYLTIKGEKATEILTG
uniref:Homing endonuclease n=1 Tax=viral metagenome TaxID=1070528 RepID=A0A6M3L8C4_9ZZZZ